MWKWGVDEGNLFYRPSIFYAMSMTMVRQDDISTELATVLADPHAHDQSERLRSLGVELYKAGRTEAALAAFEGMLIHGGEDSSLWQTITALRIQLKLPGLALEAARRAVDLEQESPDNWYNLALLLEEAGESMQALDSYTRALTLNSAHYGSLRNLPLLLAGMGRQAEARCADELLLQAYPDDPWLHFNSGDLLIGMRAAVEAEAAFRRALDLDSSFHRARYALAIALAAQGRVSEAQIERNRALVDEPDLQQDYISPLLIDEGASDGDVSPERVAVIAAFEELRIGDWRRYGAIVELYSGLVRGAYGNAPLSQHEMPYCALSLPLPEEIKRQVSRQASSRIKQSVAKYQLVRPPRSRDKICRIGYLSANFRPHPNARLMGDLYSRHDRSRFHIHAYSIGPADHSAERKRVEAGVDVFRDLGSLPAFAAAQLIANDGIDILVDLSGYTRYSCPEILALRPAPVQVSYLGYVATQGADYIDYTMLDRDVLLPHVRGYWDERIAYLPDCSYHCELPKNLPATPSRADLGLPASGLILGALHHPRKLEPATWACWMSLLKALPDACLWLLHEADEQRVQLLRNAAEHGVKADRLVFAAPVPHAEHLARLRQADVFLDTFVYNGHTTTVDALGVGVPVVTLNGDSVVARIAGSMLKAHGLPELVAKTEAEYRNLVLCLAVDETWRASLQERVRDYSRSNLFCPERKLRQIETAYEMMWARHQAGLPPEDFDVPEFPPA